MPATYNPEEIARAKHLVALAEQISTKLDRRYPRFVSFSYKNANNVDVLLDINASTWAVDFKESSAQLKIISVHEDGFPTITLSNGVTSSNIVANGSTFTTNITLPSANVASFTLTISFPQTTTFRAWSKTYTITVTSTQQPLVLTDTKYKVGDGARVDFAPGDTITISIPDTDFATKKKITLSWSSGATSMSRLIVERSTTKGSVSSNNGIQYWAGQSNWVDTVTFSSADPQTFTYRILYAADDTHFAYDTTTAFNIVSGGE